MAPSSRDRISVDLRGLKAALFERAQALGVSPSGLVRTTLAEALGRREPINSDHSMTSRLPGKGARVRLCLRMSCEQASATLDGARRAGLNPGDYVGGLVAGVPVLLGAGSRTRPPRRTDRIERRAGHVQPQPPSPDHAAAPRCVPPGAGVPTDAGHAGCRRATPPGAGSGRAGRPAPASRWIGR